MTGAGVLEVVETIEHLDFDAPCGWKPGCEHAATWVAIMSCCAHPTLLCDDHRRNRIDWLDQQRSRGAILVCARCRTPFATVRWEPLR